MPGHDQNPSNAGGDRESSDRGLFDKIAASYAKKDVIRSTSLCRKYQLMHAIEPALHGDFKCGLIIDIACGVGAPARYLSGFFGHYLGIDYSNEMIEAARIFSRDIRNTEFICSNIKDIEIQGQRADIVLAIGALHHMTDLNRVFDSLKKLAGTGARFIALEPQRANPIVQCLRWLRGRLDLSYSDQQQYFTRRDLYKLLNDNGLKDIEIKYQGFFSPPFAQVILRPQLIFVPLAHIAVFLDKLLDKLLPEFMKFLSWNVVIRARFP